MQRQQRRWWTRGITWLSLIAISGALLSGLFQLAVALAPGSREAIAQRASAALGQPVQVDAVALRWRWLWPLVDLNGVRLLDEQGATAVEVRRIRLGFSLTALARGEWVPADVDIAGVALTALITPEGQWQLRGRDHQGPAPGFATVANALKRFARLRAEAVVLRVDDQRPGGVSFSSTLQKGDLRLDEKGFELRAEWQAPGVLATRVRLRAGMAGDLAVPQAWSGRWTLDANDLSPGPALTRYWPALAAVQWGDATLTAAGDWQRGAPGATELSLRAQSLALAKQPQSLLKAVDMGLHYRPAEATESGAMPGGTVDLVPLRLTGRKGLWPAGSARLEWQQASATAPRQWRASSTFLRLDDLAPWLATLLPPQDTVPPALLASLAGDLTALEARWQPQPGGTPRYSLHARLSDAAARWPGKAAIRGASGEITADDSSGRLKLDERVLSLELPTLFDAPLSGLKLSAAAQWQRDAAGWRVTVPEWQWALLGSSGSGSAELTLPREAPAALKLQSQFDVADVAALKPLMPKHWGAPLKSWLQRAVVRGRVSKAMLRIDGPLRDFPYHREPTGQFALLLPVAGARLEYHPDWPGIDQLNATLRFAGNGLSFESRRGLINGVAIPRAVGGIADFATAPLVLDAEAAGEAPYFFALLRASPLATRLAALLRHSEAEGPVQTQLHLEVPLHGEGAQHTVARGTVALQGNTLRHRALDRPVYDITGTLGFGQQVNAEGLTASFHGVPVSARIAPGADGSDTLTATTTLDLQAEDGVAAHYLPPWLQQRLGGASEWQVSIPFAGAQSGRVRLSSQLVGSTLNLPAPFGKAAEEPRRLALELFGDDTLPLGVTGTLDDRLGLALRFARGSSNPAPELRALTLRFGPGVPPLPASEGVQLNGSLALLDPLDWRSLLTALAEPEPRRRSAGSGNPVLAFAGADLQVQTLRLAGYDVSAVRLKVQREYGGMAASVQGEGTSGSLKLTTAGDALSARFTTLQLSAAPRQPPGPPGAAGEPTDPTRAPTLDVSVEALTVGGKPFGALTLTTERSSTGQRLRRFNVSGGIATLNAEGDWRRSQGMTEAQTRFTLTSDDLAGTFEGLGFAPTIAGRNARVEGDLTWPAAARGFDWAQGRGTVSLAVQEGALRTVEPGSGGRVLGLFNFYALPRRLTLDFGDVVSKGLGFDAIEGRFKLANGVAQTDDLNVIGPSVRIAMRGTVGLAAHDYNQTITVTPNTKGITLGALLLGGASAVAAPVLPLIAVIANQVIDKPLGQVTQLSYRLTGSWENPEINKLDDEPPPPVAPAAP